MTDSCVHVNIQAIRDGDGERFIVDGVKVVCDDPVHPDNKVDEFRKEDEVSIGFDLCLNNFIAAVGKDKIQQALKSFDKSSQFMDMIKSIINTASQDNAESLLDILKKVSESGSNPKVQVVQVNAEDLPEEVLDAISRAKNNDQIGEILRIMHESDSSEEFLVKLKGINLND